MSSRTFAIVKIFYICAVQYGSQQPHVAIEQLETTSATLLTSTVANILETTVLDNIVILKIKFLMSWHQVSLKIIEVFNITDKTPQAFLAGIPFVSSNPPHSLSTSFSIPCSIPPQTFVHPYLWRFPLSCDNWPQSILYVSVYSL